MFKALRFTLRLLLLWLHFIVGLLIAALFFHWKNRQYHQHKRIVQLWLWVAAKIMGCDIQLSDDAPEQEHSLIVANHISWVDIFVLGGSFAVRFLSKSEIRSWPLFGWLSAVSGTLFIQRGAGSEEGIRLIADCLAQGDDVMIFPEATTTDGLSVKPFHPRLLKTAVSAQIAVTPVMISYSKNSQPDTGPAWTTDDDFISTLWYVLSQPKTQVQVHRFAPIKADPERSRTELAKDCHARIKTRLENLYS